MYYQELFKRDPNNPVKVCLMGAGEFGASFIIQAPKVPNMQICAVCTLDEAQAKEALSMAGYSVNDYAVVTNCHDAKVAFEQGKCVIANNFELLCGLPLEVLVESSGSPDASAKAAELAIENNMHVVMVSKETESVVGPILCKKARAKKLVYTTGDGDQPSIVIGLISWAKALGLKVICAGKSSEYDFVYDPKTRILSCNGQKQSFTCEQLDDLWEIGDRTPRDVAALRQKVVEDKLSLRANPDVCEMVLVSNATKMKFDTPRFNAPVARINELADLFCPKSDGGLLDDINTLDIFNCLRKPDELSMAGGEFVIVECEDRNIWNVLEAKGHVISKNKKYAALYIPRHIMGLETATSVMAAATLNHATGGGNLEPVTDMVGFAEVDLPEGYVLKMGGHHHTIDGVGATSAKSLPIADQSPIPFYLLSNLVLKKAVKKGQIICYQDVSIPSDSTLFRLRKEQDKEFY